MKIASKIILIIINSKILIIYLMRDLLISILFYLNMFLRIVYIYII